MRFLYWLVVFGALLLAGASAFLFFGETNMDPEAKARFAFEARVSGLRPEAEAGRSAAQYRLGQTYQTAPVAAREDDSARYWYKKAAQQGHIAAQYELGMMYLRGESVPQSYLRAAQWLRLAAGLGRHLDAQFILGDMYFYGRGVGQDYGAAIDWFRKAAERGHGIAQHVIGVMYAEGWGIEADNLEAYKWLTLALRARDKIQAYDKQQDPQLQREKLIARMNSSQIQLAKKRIRDWKATQ
jgi:uncharacterized protein